ncbi:MAG: dipeptidyl aminopeptidase/acylaminoacyl peptidase [Bacteroidia bacterium]|jgi:dipeptidyl aminopeptidase/acylaminoacyl peptidase
MTMNRLLLLLIACLSFSFLTEAQNIKSVAQKTTTHLEQDNIGKIHASFSKKTRKAFKKMLLKAAWRTVKKNNGNLVKSGKPVFGNVKGNETATIPLDFEKSSINLVITTNQNNEIIGLRFAPLAYETPSWAKNKVFGKERLTIKTDSFKLPGELLLPPDCNQCPVVILVHGSGPSDMNEGSSVSPNKLFLDLAYGFALNGIATIRYDKRTLVYQKQLANADSFTLYEETIYDAISAVIKSKSYSFLDSNRIYVLGHSLGAYASPLIAAGNSDIKGIILLAGPYRPLFEFFPEQYAYIFGLDSLITKREAKMLHLVEEEVKFIKEEPSEVQELKVLGNEKILYYFREMRTYNPAATIVNLDCRVLISQGNRDYQVRYETEFEQYKTILQNQQHVDFQLIEGANHQLIWGDVPSTPSEYYKPGHPDFEVIQMLSDWILEK